MGRDGIPGTRGGSGLLQGSRASAPPCRPCPGSVGPFPLGKAPSLALQDPPLLQVPQLSLKSFPYSTRPAPLHKPLPLSTSPLSTPKAPPLSINYSISPSSTPQAPCTLQKPLSLSISPPVQFWAPSAPRPQCWFLPEFSNGLPTSAMLCHQVLVTGQVPQWPKKWPQV